MSSNVVRLPIRRLDEIAVGLNIEGYHPALALKQGCRWYNLVFAIDEPLNGITFEDVITIKNNNGYDCIEEAVGVDMQHYVETLMKFINSIKSQHNKILVHIHQMEGTTKLGEIIKQKTNVDLILDVSREHDTPNFSGTSYNVKQVNYAMEYPDIDALVSISQCAGFGVKAGEWIIPDCFMDFDVRTNKISRKKIYVENNARDVFNNFNLNFHVGCLLVVNDLWNPDSVTSDDDYVILC